MRTHLPYYLLGLVLILGPVSLRVLTWQTPPVHDENTTDVREGHKLFVHEWQVHDSLCSDGDGLGPVYNATSCVACHHQGGLGGSGGLDHNVTTFVRNRPQPLEPRQGVVHAFATESRYLETLHQLDPQLPATSRPKLEFVLQLGHGDLGNRQHVSQRNTPALFGSKWIDEIPDRIIIAQERQEQLRFGLVDAQTETAPAGRALRLADGKIGKFGWKGQSASLAEFVQAACANELGLGNPGQAQPTPLLAPEWRTVGLDLTLRQCDQITAFCASLPKPVEQVPAEPLAHEDVKSGKQLFSKIGCAHCHTPDLGSIEGIYSDLLLHRMGEELQGSGSYVDPAPRDSSPGKGPLPDEWRTPPLWGVADSAPYLHDGRAATLDAAIRQHRGQAAAAAANFTSLMPTEQRQLLSFLRTLRAPDIDVR